VLALARHVHTAEPRGGPGVCAKDPTPNGRRPSRVGWALLMAFDGTCERGGVQRAPQGPGSRELRTEKTPPC
jgi:hypothetical protein